MVSILLAFAMVLAVHSSSQKSVSSSLMSPKQIATVDIFILKDCPIADQFLPILGKYEAEYKPKGVQFRVIFEDSSLSQRNASIHLRKYNYKGPYILDPTHKLAKLVGATTSPEAFLIDSAHKTCYHGRIDDRYLTLGSPRPYATRNDLKDAVTELLDHKPITESYANPVGCLFHL